MNGKTDILRQTKLLKENMDYPLLWVMLILLSFGLIMVYSATIAGHEAARVNNPQYYLIRQGVFISAIGIMCYGLFRIPMSFWKKATPYLIALSIGLLVLTLMIGTSVKGAKRWINLGFFSLQSSELFKIAVILYLSSFITRHYESINDIKKVWWIAIVPVLGMSLIYLTKDLGSVVVIMCIIIALILMAGMKMKWFITVILISLPLLLAAILTQSYRIKRMVSFIDPLQDALGKGYQLSHALAAAGRGGLFGKGLGNSLERFYLPESHTDFISAIIAEELGLLTVIGVAMVFIWLVWRAITIGKRAQSLNSFYSSYIAYGVGVWLGVQSFFHIGVNLGMLPTKGLTLPFISYGGSSMLATMVAMTLLLRVDYENRRQLRGYKV